MPRADWHIILIHVSQRFGNAITSRGVLNLKHSSFSHDFSPVEAACSCNVCRPVEDGGLGVTRALIYHLTAKETVGAHLLTLHNVHHQLNLMTRVRQAILEDMYPHFVKEFFENYFPQTGPPKWAVVALRQVGIDLEG